MSTEKTLATVKHGGCVQLEDGLPPLPEAWYRPNSPNAPIGQILFSEEQMMDYARAALSAQPSPGGQGELLEQVARFLDYSVGHDPWPNIRRVYGESWWEPVRKMRDELRTLAARQPVYVQGCDELRARTEGERAAYMEGLEEGKKIAARQPVGEPVAWMTHHAEPMLFPTREEASDYCEDDERPLPLYAAPPAQAVDLPYSLDADPAGIRARVADVITGTLMVGAQGHTPPPVGHWAEPFWHAARADAGLQVKMREALWAAARSLRTIADSTKETEFLETAGEIRAYAGSRANCAEQILTDSRGAKLG